MVQRFFYGFILAAAALALLPALRPAPGDATFRVDVELVTVPCVLVNKHGTVAVADVKREDFAVRDNGIDKPIEYMWREADLPLGLAILVDVSPSQASFLEQHRKTLANFLEYVIRPEDRAFIVTVGDYVKILGEPTSAPAELHRALDLIDAEQKHGEPLGVPCPTVTIGGRANGVVPACGGSAIWNAVFSAAKLKLAGLPGRKAMLILSDGIDTGSSYTFEDAVRGVQQANAVVYAIKYPAGNLVNMTRGLERLAAETGGLEFASGKWNSREIFAIVENELRNQYVLGFRPERAGKANAFHKIQVSLSRRDLKVRSRSGYFEVAAP
jgi:VWFA-related protein